MKKTSIFTMFMILAATAPATANGFKEGGKEVGEGFTKMGKEIAQFAVTSSKAVAKGFKDAGKDTGKAFKQMGQDIDKALTGKHL